MELEYSDNFYDMDNGLMEYDEPTDFRPLENIWDDPEKIEENENNKMSIDDLIQLMEKEIKKMEFDRNSIEFYYKEELIDAIPMAKIGEDAAIFKINNKLKKIKYKDINFEN